MFTSRSGTRGNPATSQQTPSIEAVRRRARHRLMGAVVLVAVGVLGFPVLFDTQPRPISVDIPIEIPAKTPITPLKPAAAPALAAVVPAPAAPDLSAAPAVAVAPATPTAPTTPTAPAATNVPAAAAAPVAAPAPAPNATASVSTRDSLSAREELLPATPPKPQPAAQPAPQPAAQKPDTAQAQALDAARAQALLDGQPVNTPRIVVQVGAFADPVRAQEVRWKLERAGLKTYTHVAQTPDGPRTRVRLGPFASREEADKAAERVKALALPAAVLKL